MSRTSGVGRHGGRSEAAAATADRRVRIKFSPGKLGMNYDVASGRITKVGDGQAKDAGVKVGWTLELVDGLAWDDQLFGNILERGKSFTLTFDTPRPAQGTAAETENTESRWLGGRLGGMFRSSSAKSAEFRRPVASPARPLESAKRSSCSVARSQEPQRAAADQDLQQVCLYQPTEGVRRFSDIMKAIFAQCTFTAPTRILTLAAGAAGPRGRSSSNSRASQANLAQPTVLGPDSRAHKKAAGAAAASNSSSSNPSAARSHSSQAREVSRKRSPLMQPIEDLPPRKKPCHAGASDSRAERGAPPSRVTADSRAQRRAPSSRVAAAKAQSSTHRATNSSPSPPRAKGRARIAASRSPSPPPRAQGRARIAASRSPSPPPRSKGRQRVAASRSPSPPPRAMAKGRARVAASRSPPPPPRAKGRARNAASRSSSPPPRAKGRARIAASPSASPSPSPRSRSKGRNPARGRGGGRGRGRGRGQHAAVEPALAKGRDGGLNVSRALAALPRQDGPQREKKKQALLDEHCFGAPAVTSMSTSSAVASSPNLDFLETLHTGLTPDPTSSRRPPQKGKPLKRRLFQAAPDADSESEGVSMRDEAFQPQGLDNFVCRERKRQRQTEKQNPGRRGAAHTISKSRSEDRSMKNVRLPMRGVASPIAKIMQRLKPAAPGGPESDSDEDAAPVADLSRSMEEASFFGGA